MAIARLLHLLHLLSDHGAKKLGLSILKYV
jgi:hypothetical protein